MPLSLWPLAAALALLSLSICAVAQVSTPESVLGHKPGDDFYLASYDDALLYFRKLAASSDRIKLIPVGKSSRGVDWEVALISSPQNRAQCITTKKSPNASRKLVDSPPTSPSSLK